MRKGWMSRLGVATAMGWLVLGGASATGCAGEKDPIVQVQSNYIKKSDLVGTDKDHPTEWYIRNTVIDVRRSNPFAFPGMQDNLRRVRWDIQENYLIARRAYELVSGSDGKGASAKTNDGVIVAMYPISKQFDIRRAYETSTGEERNILVENDVDRVWYERDYVRVDWSQNLVSDPDFEELWFPKVFGEMNVVPVQYFDSDPKSPSAPVLDSANGYFDITSKFVVESEKWQFRYFSIPTCYIYNLYTGTDTTDCNDQEMTVRTAFMKVPDRDYEAAETSGDKFTMFGTFNRERYGYDRQYGVIDTALHQYMARHNLWKQSHLATASGDVDKLKTGQIKALPANLTCGTPDQSKQLADQACAAATPGSNCDMNAGLCTIPFEKRTLRKVPYFLDATMPKDLEASNAALLGEWNDALKLAVATTRETECRAAGGDKDACHGKHFNGDKAKTESEIVVMCHNPMVSTDDPSCRFDRVGNPLKDPAGNPVQDGYVVRQGDLRFNLIGWIDSPLAAAPLGYGPDGADPLTGEVLQSTAYIYGASLDSYVAMTRDLVAIANGDLNPEQFVAGVQVDQNLGTYDPKSAATMLGKMDPDLFAPYGKYMQGKLADTKPVGMTDAEIKARFSGINANEFVDRLGAAGRISPDATAAQRLSAVKAMISESSAAGVAGFGGAAEAQAHDDTLAARLVGTGSERIVTDDNQFLLANAITTSKDMDADTLRKMVSPFGDAGFMEIANLAELRRKHFEDNGVCMFGTDEFNAPHIEGLARRLKNKYLFDTSIPGDCAQPADGSEEAFAAAAVACRQKKVFTELRSIIYKAVTEHEVGHTMALRHNFQGSWDAVNFHPNYWKLRTADGAHTKKYCTTAHDQKTDSCMGPRYLDPISDNEEGLSGQPGIAEFEYSTIMDYGYDFNTDLHGIGAYDLAAMKFIYGGVVETMPEGSVAATNGDKTSPINISPITEQWMVKGTTGMEPVHYTKLADLFGLYAAERCHDAGPGEEADAVGGQVCTAVPKDHAFVSEMISAEVLPGQQPAAYYKSSKTGAYRWPYRFGTDEFAHYPHILRFDAGADIYEGAVNVRNLYEYRYVLDYWRRARREWHTFAVQGRLWDRYFSRFHTLGWQAAYKTAQYSAMYPGKTPETNPALTSDDWGRGYVLAASILFEALERTALRPQPGGYDQVDPATIPDVTGAVFQVPDFTPGTKFKVSTLDGRYVDELFDNDVGGSFYYLSYLQRMGTYVEKPLSAIALSISFPPVHTYTRDKYLDERTVLLNFRSVMPQAYDRLYAGILAGDLDTVAPYVNKGLADKTTKVVPQVLYTPLWTADATRTGAVTLIDPLVGYKLQGAAIIYGLYFGTEDGSQGLTNSMRVWVEGGPEGITLPDSEKVIFVEPDSGIVWAARRSGFDTVAGTKVEKGIGARMLVHANRLLALAYDVKTDADGMPMYDADHRIIWNDPTKPGTILSTDNQAILKKYVGVINVERNAVWDMGIGPRR